MQRSPVRMEKDNLVARRTNRQEIGALHIPQRSRIRRGRPGKGDEPVSEIVGPRRGLGKTLKRRRGKTLQSIDRLGHIPLSALGSVERTILPNSLHPAPRLPLFLEMRFIRYGVELQNFTGKTGKPLVEGLGGIAGVEQLPRGPGSLVQLNERRAGRSGTALRVNLAENLIQGLDQTGNVVCEQCRPGLVLDPLPPCPFRLSMGRDIVQRFTQLDGVGVRGAGVDEPHHQRAYPLVHGILLFPPGVVPLLPPPHPQGVLIELQSRGGRRSGGVGLVVARREDDNPVALATSRDGEIPRFSGGKRQPIREPARDPRRKEVDSAANGLPRDKPLRMARRRIFFQIQFVYPIGNDLGSVLNQFISVRIVMPHAVAPVEGGGKRGLPVRKQLGIRKFT